MYICIFPFLSISDQVQQHQAGLKLTPRIVRGTKRSWAKACFTTHQQVLFFLQNRFNPEMWGLTNFVEFGWVLDVIFLRKKTWKNFNLPGIYIWQIRMMWTLLRWFFPWREMLPRPSPCGVLKSSFHRVFPVTGWTINNCWRNMASVLMLETWSWVWNGCQRIPRNRMLGLIVKGKGQSSETVFLEKDDAQRIAKIHMWIMPVCVKYVFTHMWFKCILIIDTS